jgi:hypothetical protein
MPQANVPDSEHRFLPARLDTHADFYFLLFFLWKIGIFASSFQNILLSLANDFKKLSTAACTPVMYMFDDQ